MFFNRIVGVFRLSPATFEEIEHDPGATPQAAMMVILVAFLAGFGSGLTAVISQGNFVRGFFSALVAALVGWVLWSIISYFVGVSLFGGKATLGEMLRVIGFATAPLLLGIIPFIGGLIGAIWALAAGFVALRQGLDLDNSKTILTVLIGAVLYLIAYLILSLTFGSIFRI